MDTTPYGHGLAGSCLQFPLAFDGLFLYRLIEDALLGRGFVFGFSLPFYFRVDGSKDGYVWDLCFVAFSLLLYSCFPAIVS